MFEGRLAVSMRTMLGFGWFPVREAQREMKPFRSLVQRIVCDLEFESSIVDQGGGRLEMHQIVCLAKVQEVPCSPSTDSFQLTVQESLSRMVDKSDEPVLVDQEERFG